MSGSPAQDEVTRLLSRVGDGDESAASDLLPLVYDELRRLAGSYMRREQSDHTLQPTALVHEAYLRLVDQTRVCWQDRTHFFAVAATCMRRILVNHARDRRRLKRGGGARRVTLQDLAETGAVGDAELVDLDDALKRLERLDERKVRVVEFRFFAGLTVEQTAELLDLSPVTVKRDWEFARAWLLNALVEGADHDA